MELIHTSPNKIDSIYGDGFLCFSVNEYSMCARDDYVTYAIDVADEELVDCNSYFYRDDYEKLDDIVEEVMSLLGCDRDFAEEVLSERQSPDTTDSEILWEIQRLTAKCAVVLGYRGAIMTDEQGTLYMIKIDSIDTLRIQK